MLAEKTSVVVVVAVLAVGGPKYEAVGGGRYAGGVPDPVECRCCENLAKQNSHQFISGTCDSEASVAPALASMLGASRWNENVPEWTESESVEPFGDSFLKGSDLLFGRSSGAFGETAECSNGTTCHKDRPSGGAGGGPGCSDDCEFHDLPEGGNCSHHPSCGEPEELAILEALDAGSYSVVAEHIKRKPGKMWINDERGMLQIANCRGQVATQVKIDVSRLAAFLQ